MPSQSKSSDEALAERIDRATEKVRERRQAKARERAGQGGNFFSSLIKATLQLHTGAGHGSDASMDYNQSDVGQGQHHSSHGPQFGDDGRYPQGTDSNGDKIAQSSLGDPYKTSDPSVKVDPKDAKWP